MRTRKEANRIVRKLKNRARDFGWRAYHTAGVVSQGYVCCVHAGYELSSLYEDAFEMFKVTGDQEKLRVDCYDVARRFLARDQETRS